MTYQFIQYKNNINYYDIHVDDKVTITLSKYKKDILIEIVQIYNNEIYGIILTDIKNSINIKRYQFGNLIKFKIENILNHIPYNDHILINIKNDMYNLVDTHHIIKIKSILFYIQYNRYPNENEINEIINNKILI